MPETVKMALSRCYQTITNVASQGEKLEKVFPLDNGHFITGEYKNNKTRIAVECLICGNIWITDARGACCATWRAMRTSNHS